MKHKSAAWVAVLHGASTELDAPLLFLASFGIGRWLLRAFCAETRLKDAALMVHKRLWGG